MLKEIIEDILKIDDVLFVVRSNGTVSEIRSNSLRLRQKEKWITVGDNDGPAHMHLDSESIKRAEFVMEQKPERASFSVRFFDENDQRVLGVFFTKMYDENKNLNTDRAKIYDHLNQKFGPEIEF